MNPSHRVGPETARLTLRAMTVDDAEAFYRLNGDPVVMRYTHEPLLRSIEEARAAIAAYPDFDAVGFGRWGCYLKETGRMIGFCGLKRLDGLDEVDLGFRFMPEFWGRGLATEAASASLQFGFNVLKLNRVIGLVLPENAASARVLEKVGMAREAEITYDGLRVLRYAAHGEPTAR